MYYVIMKDIAIVDPIYLKDVNKLMHGNSVVLYKNAVFNELSYLTHDIALPK